jgi:hypothetical protein
MKLLLTTQTHAGIPQPMGALLALCIDLLTGASFVLSCPALLLLLLSAFYYSAASSPSSSSASLSSFYDFFLSLLCHAFYWISANASVLSPTETCQPSLTQSSFTHSFTHSCLFFLPILNFPFVSHLILPDYILSHYILTICRARTSHFPCIRAARELDHEGASKKRQDRQANILHSTLLRLRPVRYTEWRCII